MRGSLSAARLVRWAAPLLIAALLGACAAVQTRALSERWPDGLARRVELDQTPFFAQTAYQCGPAALATALVAAGVPADPSPLAEQVFLPARTGTLQVEMIAGARRQGAVATRLPATLEALLREVQAGHPVVVLQNLGLTWAPMWHYAVLIGYDADAGDVLLRSGTTRRLAMAMRTFEHTWQRAGAWAFVALTPGHWPATAELPAALEASVGFERAATPQQALQVYRSALARWPGNLTLQMGLGNSLYAAGEKAQAAETFRDAALRHRSAPAWINLASTLLVLGRSGDAVDAAQRAVAASDPTWRAQADTVLQRALAAAAAARR